MPFIPVPRRSLSDGRVSLRLIAERDIPEILIAYEDDDGLHERLGQPRPPSGAELGRINEQVQQALADGVRVELTLTEAGADTCVGLLTLDALDWDRSEGLVSLWVAPAKRGRGYGAAALRLAADWALRECGLARLFAHVERDNAAMHRAAVAAGFRAAGSLTVARAAGRRNRTVELDRLVLGAEHRPEARGGGQGQR